MLSIIMARRGRVAVGRATLTLLWEAALGCSRAPDEVVLIRICHQSQTCQVGGDDRHPPSRACCQGGGNLRPSSLTPWAITTSSPMTTEMIEGLVLV
mmetsp:Transcript_52990/g.120822  ORF Transcript_52990/g.120822 Transcript_52990/m.120822 type:complete len:97 (+) Transcript_52990:44-334(+)